MKKLFLALSAVAAIALASCIKEDIGQKGQEQTPEYKMVSKTFHAGYEIDEETKVVMSDGMYQWKAGDVIGVFDSGTKTIQPFTAVSDGPSTDFEGFIPDVAKAPYYAIYPYDENAVLTVNETEPAKSTIKTVFPSVQTAVANSIPAETPFVALSEDGENFKFVTAAGFVKFTMTEDNITEVILSDHTAATLVANLSINMTGGTSGPSNGLSYISLKGDFQKGNDYYFALRGGAFSAGLTISYHSAGNPIVYKSYNYPPQSSASRNRFVSLGKVTDLKTIEEAPLNDLYTKYIHGFDLEFDGKVYNRYNDDVVTLLSPSSSAAATDLRNIRSNINNAGGVFLLDSRTGTKFTLGSNANISNYVVIANRYSDSKADFVEQKTKNSSGNDTNPYFILVDKTGRLHLENIQFDMSDQVTYLMQIPQTAVPLGLNISNCRFNSMKTTLLTVSTPGNGTNTAGIGEIIIRDCDFASAAAEEAKLQLINFSRAARMDQVGKFVFENNVLYYAAGKNAYYQIFSSDETTAQTGTSVSYDTEVSFCNNTIYNLVGWNIYLKFYEAKSLTIKNNLLRADPTAANGSYLLNIASETQDATVIEVSDNKVYGIVDTKNWQTVQSSKSKWIPVPNNIQRETEDLFETVDVTSGVFIPKADYALLGAQRDWSKYTEAAAN